ncbi:scavenger mRNA decapping enzyme [Russula earlei]|uniref:Scavenger mRNA decapping enzyme n=1 Tax=Russula earlei TaxID=71964 RepID=A0ACC0UIT9_9AGAM|nr:scavenger mRNA decapping enzyme [Russula earlei]
MDFQLNRFVFERVLNEDLATHSVALLGTLRPPSSETSYAQGNTAIVRIERTALPSFTDGLIATAKLVGNTDIYAWMVGWLSHSENKPDVKINVICPATEVHIRKYSKQQIHIVRETPALYERIVRPYIDAFPASRTQWIEEIVSGRSEAENILFRSPPEADPFGFLILPDMKWDLANIASLYLVALMVLPNIKNLRDLNRSHLPLLRSIRREAANIVKKRWCLEATELRLFVHYQPSYYHFHVHIVNANHTGLLGMTVGQAHILDDIISLLELDDPTGPSIFQRMTLSYGLGEQHGLFSTMKAAQAEFQESEESS